MENITELFNEVYRPVKSIVIYQSEMDTDKVYVEAFDMNGKGCPINAHPLTVQETIALAECFNSSAELSNDYLRPEGLIPEKVLSINPTKIGHVIWYTERMEADLLFIEDLGIESGKAEVPAMIWKADKGSLTIYALAANAKPNAETPLYNAPFFNIHHNGSVCMGTVDVDTEAANCLEDFIGKWESYFWNSYFSHLIGEQSPVRGNIVQLWQKMVNTGTKFPMEVLIKNGKQLKDVL